MRSPVVRPLVGLLAVVAAALTACAPAPIYKSTPATVAAPPSQVAAAADQYRNATVIWGGRVISVSNLADHSEIEVLDFPLDSSQRPRSKGKASGRFIAVLPGFVEPMDYPPGTPITVAGQVTDVRDGTVGNAPYRFPLVSVQQHHAWTAEEMRKGHPNINFGVGVGVGVH